MVLISTIIVLIILAGPVLFIILSIRGLRKGTTYVSGLFFSKRSAIRRIVIASILALIIAIIYVWFTFLDTYFNQHPFLFAITVMTILAACFVVIILAYLDLREMKKNPRVFTAHFINEIIQEEIDKSHQDKSPDDEQKD